jgi:hypothetical protein
MNDKREFERAIDRWMDDGSDATSPRIIEAVLLAARSIPQEGDLRVPWRDEAMRNLALAAAVVTAIVVGGAALAAFGPRFGIGSEPTPPHGPSADLGIFEPVAGWIVYGHDGGIWGVDPATPTNRVQLTSEVGTPLGWSSDGTQLLIARGVPGGEHLFILHADGSETQVTDQPMSIGAATFSADGSRVLFAAESPDDHWTVYALDADGGPATVLTSPIDPSPAALAFSPDGTQIAYVLWGRGDSEHPVWVMDADGTDAHEILANDVVMGGGHLRGDRRGAVAWSPAGDRIALALEGTIYTFATDGSDFQRVTWGNTPLWSPNGSQVVGRSAATWHPGKPADGAGR